jgi:L-aminopeptidase/D-esterase-like protein
MPSPGPLNLITDVPGITVGHAADDKAASGVTTLLLPEAWTAGVDIRGGGPGVRETAALEPENLNSLAHAIVLAGGSVFGLAAADGVAALLSQRGVGLTLYPPSPAIPIVPSAVLFDLANEGDKKWGLTPPYRDLGMRSVAEAGRNFVLGSVGAGRGAMAGLVKGGVGSASLDLGGGIMVGALAAANPVGSALMPDGKTYWAWPFEFGDEFGGHRPSGAADAHDPIPDLSRLLRIGRLQPGANTTIAVVAVSARLSPAECKRLAIMAQDGVSRAIRPAHTPFDGDTVFAVAEGVDLPAPGSARTLQIARLGSAGADCLARAIARAVHYA